MLDCKINRIANEMTFFGNRFKNRCWAEIEMLLDEYNPEYIKYYLKTFSVHLNLNHYNPNTGEWWRDKSADKVTFSKTLSPNEMRERILYLAKYNFEMTEYQYNCDDQRKLMNSELKHRIIVRDGMVCQECGKRCLQNEIEIDHIKPVSKGGKTVESNLQVLCRSCNRSKSNKWVEPQEETVLSLPKITPKSSNTLSTVKEPVTPVVCVPRVQIGDTITVKYMDMGTIKKLTLCGSIGDSYNRGVISVSSPIGSAVFGKTVGSVLEVRTPVGVQTIRIVDIRKGA